MPGHFIIVTIFFMQDFGWRNGADAGGTLEDSLFAVPPDFKEDPGRFPDL